MEVCENSEYFQVTAPEIVSHKWVYDDASFQEFLNNPLSAPTISMACFISPHHDFQKVIKLRLAIYAHNSWRNGLCRVGRAFLWRNLSRGVLRNIEHNTYTGMLICGLLLLHLSWSHVYTSEGRAGFTRAINRESGSLNISSTVLKSVRCRSNIKRRGWLFEQNWLGSSYFTYMWLPEKFNMIADTTALIFCIPPHTNITLCVVLVGFLYMFIKYRFFEINYLPWSTLTLRLVSHCWGLSCSGRAHSRPSPLPAFSASGCLLTCYICRCVIRWFSFVLSERRVYCFSFFNIYILQRLRGQCRVFIYISHELVHITLTNIAACDLWATIIIPIFFL